MSQINLLAKDIENPIRVDSYLAKQLDKSRSQIQEMIKEGLIKINGKVCRVSTKVKLNDSIDIDFIPLKELDIQPENIKLDILYEDRELVVVNKPRGMVVHPAPSVKEATLVNALMAHCNDLSGIGGVLRPGIVHRLDKDTSGILIVAKNDQAHHLLSFQFSQRQINKEYIALVHGIPNKDRGLIDAPIGRHKTNRKKFAINVEGKPSQTNYTVIEKFDNYALLRVVPLTGRTHQIRVHLNALGHPIAGDLTYGKKQKTPFELEGQFLHAHLLGFTHPRKKKYMEFTAPLPPELENILNFLRGKNG